MSKFIRYKINTLSNRNLKDAKKLAEILRELHKGVDSIEKLRFLAKSARNIGIGGINTYFKPLDKFYEWISYIELDSLEQIDEEVVIDFLSSETGGLSDATKKNYRMAILAFFNYISKQNEQNGKSFQFRIELKNWGGLRGKSGQKLPEYLDEGELKRFVEAIDTYPFSHKIAARNRLIIKIILYTGIRVSEAINLKTKDFIDDGEVYMLKIVGKGNKHRVVMIKKSHILSDLHEWQSIRNCNNNLLFCNSKGNALTQAYISRSVEQILISIGIRKEKNGAHLLRHSFATLLYQKSKDLVLVQEALGHASLDTSRIYTHFDKERLKQATQIMDDL